MFVGELNGRVRRQARCPFLSRTENRQTLSVDRKHRLSISHQTRHNKRVLVLLDCIQARFERLARSASYLFWQWTIKTDPTAPRRLNYKMIPCILSVKKLSEGNPSLWLFSKSTDEAKIIPLGITLAEASALAHTNHGSHRAMGRYVCVDNETNLRIRFFSFFFFPRPTKTCVQLLNTTRQADLEQWSNQTHFPLSPTEDLGPTPPSFQTVFI